MMYLSTIGEDVLQGHHVLSGLKHCMEISDEQPKKRICGPSRRIPCRARSLSNSHNADTAYFDVPCDAPHGLPLTCSHEECIKSGRRFRYCKVCELPVAKRNFVKRHGHSMVNSAKELRETVDKMVPDKKVKKSLMEIMSSEFYNALHEISGDEESQDGIDMSSYEFKRSVSFDETSLDGESSKASSLDLGPSEQLWLPADHVEISNASTTPPIVEHYQHTPIHVIIPPSPPTHPCMVSPVLEAVYYEQPKVVPLVEPGATITEWEFAEAIAGIDFSKVFD